MRVAICDDDLSDLQEIRRLVDQYDPLQKSEIDLYIDAMTFYHAHQKDPFDLAILDIEMPDPQAPNGYDIAQKIVKENIAPPLILFVTNSLDYTVKGYGVAFRYIPKPLQRASFFEVLNVAIKEIAANRFLFSSNCVNYSIRLRDIYYFEVKDHTTMLHTSEETFEIHESLKNITGRLPPAWFGAPHISFLVNMDHVKGFSKMEVHMDNHVSVPLTRGKYTSFTEQFYRFMEK